MKKTTPEVIIETLRILKVGNCPSRSGRSHLTYQIGCDAKSQLHIRIKANTGKGFFNDDWIGVQSIQSQLSKCGTQFSSFALNVFFQGKSMNTPFFMLAILMAEGLIKTSAENRRCYELGDFEGFLSRMQPLIDSDTSLPDDQKPAKVTKQVAKSERSSKLKADSPTKTAKANTSAKALQTNEDDAIVDTLLEPQA